MELIQPLLFYKLNRCPLCKTNSLELFSYMNYPSKYDENATRYFNNEEALPYKYGVYALKCRMCGTNFNIKWEDGFPKPMFSNTDLKIFMGRWQDLYKQDQKKINIKEWCE